MRIKLKDTVRDKLVDAQLILAEKVDMPLTKNGWKFEWNKLFDEGGTFYKVIIDEEPQVIQGIMKFSIDSNEMFYLENVEIAPHNYGSKGRYDYVAGCLFAYACKQSKILGKGNYEGWVVFDSKTILIEFYQNKYGATIVHGQRMFFDPETGDKLIAQYL